MEMDDKEKKEQKKKLGMIVFFLIGTISLILLGLHRLGKISESSYAYSNMPIIIAMITILIWIRKYNVNNRK